LSTTAKTIVLLFSTLLLEAQYTDPQQQWIPENLKRWEVEERYDRFKDVTFVNATTPLLIELPTYQRAPMNSYYYSLTTLTIFHACPGKVSICRALSVSMTFSLCTSSWTFDDTDVYIVADDKRFSFPKPKWDGEVLEGRNLNETVTIEIEPKLFKELASASHISAQVGRAEVEFSVANLSAIHQIAQRLLVPQAQPSRPDSKSPSHSPARAKIPKK
jgi:hypothetical protein